MKKKIIKENTNINERTIECLELIYVGNSKTIMVPKEAIVYFNIKGITKEIEVCEKDLYESYECNYFVISLNGNKLDSETKNYILNQYNLLAVNITYSDNIQEYCCIPFKGYSCEHYDDCYRNVYQKNMYTDNENGFIDSIGITVGEQLNDW